MFERSPSSFCFALEISRLKAIYHLFGSIKHFNEIYFRVDGFISFPLTYFFYMVDLIAT